MNFTVTNHRGEELVLAADPLASAGGEGAVHAIESPKRYRYLCVKYYHAHLSDMPAREAKLACLQKEPIRYQSNPGFSLCQPEQLIYTGGSFRGFTMLRADADALSGYQLATGRAKTQAPWQNLDRDDPDAYMMRLRIAMHLACAVHCAQRVSTRCLVDLKPKNFLVNPNGHVWLIDLDSLHVNERGQSHEGKYWTQEYAPPEAHRLKGALASKTTHWGDFSYAVTLYEILHGIHPFIGKTCDPYSHVEEISDRISQGLFPGGSRQRYFEVIPPPHNRYAQLSPNLRNHFLRAFDRPNNLRQRPTAREWAMALRKELQRLSSRRKIPPPPPRSPGRTQPKATTRAAKTRKPRGSKLKAKQRKRRGWLAHLLLFLGCFVVFPGFLYLLAFSQSLRDSHFFHWLQQIWGL